jgi:hypothetical protein
MNNMANKAILVQGGDGTVIPPGTVGYVKETVVTSNVTLSTTLGTYTDVATITLNKGEWELECYANIYAPTIGGSGCVIGAISLTNNTPTAIRTSYGSSAPSGMTGYTFSCIKYRFSVTADGTIFRARAAFILGSESPTVTSPAVVADSTSPFVLRATLFG